MNDKETTRVTKKTNFQNKKGQCTEVGGVPNVGRFRFWKPDQFELLQKANDQHYILTNAWNWQTSLELFLVANTLRKKDIMKCEKQYRESEWVSENQRKKSKGLKERWLCESFCFAINWESCNQYLPFLFASSSNLSLKHEIERKWLGNGISSVRRFDLIFFQKFGQFICSCSVALETKQNNSHPVIQYEKYFYR
jgi:hypothetical protein